MDLTEKLFIRPTAYDEKSVNKFWKSDNVSKLMQLRDILAADELTDPARSEAKAHEVIRKGLGDFPGVEHRLEKVCRVDGVQYVNDSKATNVDACWYALESMTTPTILILGGKDKGNDYTALNEVLKDYPDARVFGDIGCYTLGFLPPFKAIHSCVDMGASIGMAKGAADAGQWPSVAVIGDSTFTHSGMTGLLDAINENSNITVIISDNLTTAMTGGQDSAGTNKFEAICRGLGLDNEHLKVVVPIPKNMPEITRILREEIEYKGVSVIIPRRECMQTLQRHIKQQRLAKEAKKARQAEDWLYFSRFSSSRGAVVYLGYGYQIQSAGF